MVYKIYLCASRRRCCAAFRRRILQRLRDTDLDGRVEIWTDDAASGN